MTPCLDLLPATVTAPTPGAPIPPVRTLGSIAVYADAQTGQLDKANADKAAIIGFEARCRDRDAALVKAVTKKPWWKIGG